MEPDPEPRLALSLAMVRAAVRRLAPEPGALGAARLANRLTAEGILGLALEACPELHEHPDLTTRIRADRLQTLSLLVDAGAISSDLGRAGIPHAFLYGAPLLRLYADAAWRPLRDLDLWVPPAAAGEVHRLLARLGLSRAYHGDVVFHRPLPVPSNLDLHSRVLPLSEPRQAILSKAGELPRLEPASELLSLLWRALVHHGRLRWIWRIDLALLLQREHARLDPEAFQRRLRALGLEPVAAHAARALEGFLSENLLAPLRQSRRRARLAERLARSFWEGGGFRGAGVLAEAYWGPGPAHTRAAAILRRLFPSRDFLMRRYGPAGHAGVLGRRLAHPVRLAGRMMRLTASLI